ncbi:MAG: peptidyl-prolyl cis-trans isomerase [Desulfobacteraceae bacterium]|nr:peptidyl-prolyl cis-trans isomerase [Desulfobacteraceae bacterium]
MKKRLIVLVFFSLVFASITLASESNPKVSIITNMGDIVIELDATAAPLTVKNFLMYARDGFYDNTIFHRVIKNFMIQGGGFTRDMIRKSTQEPIRNEADNGLKNMPGTIAMARTSNPHSATSQFFINAAGNDFLNHRTKTQQGWGYCVFGKVVSGMDVVTKIENLPTAIKSGMKDVPVNTVLIKRIIVDTKNTIVP